MKIKINATGEIVDEPLNTAQRKINKGIASVVKDIAKPKSRKKKKKNESNTAEEKELSSIEVESQEW